MFVRPAMFSVMIVSVWVWWMSVAGYSGLPRRRATIAFLVALARRWRREDASAHGDGDVPYGPRSPAGGTAVG